MGRFAKALRKYERRFSKGISLIVGFGKLGERLNGWAEARKITQRSQERKEDNLNRNQPTS